MPDSENAIAKLEELIAKNAACADLEDDIEIIEDCINENKCLNIALDALREKIERDNPKPLTLDELKQMDGKPIWFEDLTDSTASCWVICHWHSGKHLVLQGISKIMFLPEECGIAWLPFRSKKDVT